MSEIRKNINVMLENKKNNDLFKALLNEPIKQEKQKIK